MASEVPPGWKSQRFSDVLTIRRGHDLPKRSRAAGEIPVMGSSGRVGSHNEAKVTGPTFVLGRAANIGSVHWIDGPAWPLNTTLYPTDFHRNDPLYLFYLMKTIDFSIYDSGSVQPMLNRNYVAGHQLVLPPLDEQRAIAEILGSLDAKAAHDKGTAQLLLRQVELEYEHLPRDTFPTATVGDVLNVAGGGTPSTKEPSYWNGDHNWLTPKDLSSSTRTTIVSTARKLTATGIAKVSSGALPPGTVVMSSRAPIGLTGILAEPSAVNQGFIAFKPIEAACPGYVYAWVKTSIDAIKSRAGGSTFAEISKRALAQMPFPVPTGPAYEAFCRSSQDSLSLVERLESQVEASERARGVLLPQLVTGKLRIRDVDRFLARAGPT